MKLIMVLKIMLTKYRDVIKKKNWRPYQSNFERIKKKGGNYVLSALYESII